MYIVLKSCWFLILQINGFCVLLRRDQISGNNVLHKYCKDLNPQMEPYVYITLHSIIGRTYKFCKC